MVRRASGFTIIEVSTVLAITGLLAVMILAGIGRSLAQRQYIDAVNQTIDFFRGQYTSAENISNDRTSQQACSKGIVVTAPTGSATAVQPRGASDCLLLGNIITSNDGSSILVRQVVATQLDDTTDVPSTDSIEKVLGSSALEAGQTVDTYSVDSGATLLNPASDKGLSFALMVIRMPTTGTIVTYAKTGGSLRDVAPASLVSAENKKSLTMCIDQSGTLGFAMNPMGIVIEKAAANTTDVQSIAAGECHA